MHTYMYAYMHMRLVLLLRGNSIRSDNTFT